MTNIIQTLAHHFNEYGLLAVPWRDRYPDHGEYTLLELYDATRREKERIGTIDIANNPFILSLLEPTADTGGQPHWQKYHYDINDPASVDLLTAKVMALIQQRAKY